MKVAKNNQITLNLPVYDLKSQYDYIKYICDDLELDINKVVSFILADFILGVQKGLVEKKMDMNEIMFNYFALAEKQTKEFERLKELSENATTETK